MKNYFEYARLMRPQLRIRRLKSTVGV